MFENYSKCRIPIFEFWYFPQTFILLLKLTCLAANFRYFKMRLFLWISNTMDAFNWPFTKIFSDSQQLSNHSLFDNQGYHPKYPQKHRVEKSIKKSHFEALRENFHWFLTLVLQHLKNCLFWNSLTKVKWSQKIGWKSQVRGHKSKIMFCLAF